MSGPLTEIVEEEVISACRRTQWRQAFLPATKWIILTVIGLAIVSHVFDKTTWKIAWLSSLMISSALFPFYLLTEGISTINNAKTYGRLKGIKRIWDYEVMEAIRKSGEQYE